MARTGHPGTPIVMTDTENLVIVYPSMKECEQRTEVSSSTILAHINNGKPYQIGSRTVFFDYAIVDKQEAQA